MDGINMFTMQVIFLVTAIPFGVCIGTTFRTAYKESRPILFMMAFAGVLCLFFNAFIIPLVWLQ